jgi:hypothetical protein
MGAAMSALPSWAVPGARVVCVDDSPGCFGEAAPFAKGDILTIEGLHPYNRSVELVECKYYWGGRSLPFLVDRFRPLVTLEDDIANHFQAHLDHTTPADLERV